MLLKYILLLHLTTMFFICGCRELMKDPVKDFIPGTYIRFAQHEFGKEYDTLIITLQNQSANEYNIVRKWKYERVLDGLPIEPEYKRFLTSGIYNDDQKLLQETETGDFYSFDVKRKLLFNGPVKYQQL